MVMVSFKNACVYICCDRLVVTVDPTLWKNDNSVVTQVRILVTAIHIHHRFIQEYIHAGIYFMQHIIKKTRNISLLVVLVTY